MSRRDVETSTYTLQVHHATERAWLVSSSEDSQSVWLPKSQAEQGAHKGRSSEGKDIYEFEIPDWLAEEKGLA